MFINVYIYHIVYASLCIIFSVDSSDPAPLNTPCKDDSHGKEDSNTINPQLTVRYCKVINLFKDHNTVMKYIDF